MLQRRQLRLFSRYYRLSSVLAREGLHSWRMAQVWFSLAENERSRDQCRLLVSKIKTFLVDCLSLLLQLVFIFKNLMRLLMIFFLCQSVFCPARSRLIRSSRIFLLFFFLYGLHYNFLRFLQRHFLLKFLSLGLLFGSFFRLLLFSSGKHFLPLLLFFSRCDFCCSLFAFGSSGELIPDVIGLFNENLVLFVFFFICHARKDKFISVF